jgi:hypothetical protein
MAERGGSSDLTFQLQAWEEPRQYWPTGAKEPIVIGGRWVDVGPTGDLESRKVEKRWHERASFTKYRILGIVPVRN